MSAGSLTSSPKQAACFKVFNSPSASENVATPLMSKRLTKHLPLDEAGANRLPPRQHENPREPQKDLAIWLRRICPRQFDAIAIEGPSARSFVERTQKRCEAGRLHEIDDRSDPLEGVKIGRLPDVDGSADEAEARVEALHHFVERTSLDDWRELRGPRSVGGNHSQERALAAERAPPWKRLVG